MLPARYTDVFSSSLKQAVCVLAKFLKMIDLVSLKEHLGLPDLHGSHPSFNVVLI